MTEVDQYFRPMIGMGARGVVILGVVAIAFGAALHLLPWRSPTDQLILYACTALLVGLGVIVIVQAVQAYRRNPTLTVLLERPADVVWVYSESFVTPQFFRPAFASIIVCTRTSEQLALPCVRGRQDEALAGVAPVLPHAFTGWDYEIERQFRRNPSRLGPEDGRTG